MRIAYILNSTDPMGGATKSFLSMLQGVIEHGHQTMVVVPDNGGICQVLNAMGSRVLTLNYRPNIYPYHRSFGECLLWVPRIAYQQGINLIASKQLTSALCDYKPDIIHTNVSVIDIGRCAANRLGVPHVYHFREYGDLDFSMQYVPCKPSFMRTVDYSICITEGIRQHHGLSTNSRSRVIYNPISRKQTSLPEMEQGDYLLFAGRLEPAKGVEQLIDAYAESQVSLPLWIAGNSYSADYVQSLKKKVEEVGLHEKILFLGARSDVQELMRKACALVVPSFFEAFGRCAAEAMFQGCLVIGRDTAGTREQFENGLSETGAEIGLRFSTVPQLISCLKQVEYGSDFQEMRKRAFDTVNNLYTVETNVKQVLDFYNEILQ